MRTTKLRVPLLAKEVAAAFDTFVAEQKKARRAKSHELKAAAAKETVIEAMGKSLVGLLPDGRLLQRVEKSRRMPARPAREDKWEELVAKSSE